MMIRLTCCVFLLTSICSAGDSPRLLLRQPTLSQTQIVFVYAGDLWSVAREGGQAQRLTTGQGTESRPAFSPDGTRIAFTGEYDGNVDAFVIPARGGVPQRLTWHPDADAVLGWTPDGQRVLFSSSRTAYSRFAELFTVGLGGRLPERLPLPAGFEGSYSSDGEQLAYVPLRRAFYAWKRYRGGGTTPIWLARLSDSHIQKVPRDNSNDFNPMWVGDAVYFLSDRNGPVSLFRHDPGAGEVEQVVENDGLDLKSASAGPDAIVYEQFGGLHLYDLQSGTSSRVPVTIAGDLPELRERLVDVGGQLGSAEISPTGARAVFAARGEILTVPAEKGDVRNLTGTSGVMERDPVWSPGGSEIAYLSDESGEYQLHVRDQQGRGEVRRISLGDEPSFFFSPRWSPDGKKVAYLDSGLRIWYVDVSGEEKPVLVDRGHYWVGYQEQVPEWSPDSRYLAYEKKLPNFMNAVFIHSLETGKTTRITDGMSDAKHPVFDKGGKYLYFSASTDAGASMQPDIHSFSRPVSRSLYLVVLPSDEPSPLAPESDEEKTDDEAEDDGKKKGEDAKKKEDSGDEEKKDEPEPIRIDFEGIGQRILGLPLPARRYVGLQVGEKGFLYALEAPAPGPGIRFELTVHRFGLDERKADVPMKGVTGFVTSHDGKKVLVRRGEQWLIASLGPLGDEGGSPPADEKALNTSSVQVRVKPREEWQQMYREAWRIERDFFYDPGFHGLDLEAAETRYEPYLEGIASRADLSYLFAEMLGELTVGHLFVAGGDVPSVKRVRSGLLGADYELDAGRYRFAHIFSGENWNPDLKAPLTQPGVDVSVGDYLLEVDGRPLSSDDNVHAFFEATAGESVLLKVGPDPEGKDAREVTVVPVAGESRLRHLAWIEDNRREVDLLTDGRVAYIYMPDTFFGGYTAFNRYFFAQVGKQAAIIDERFNAGGMLATDIVEILNRRLMSLVATRDGADEIQPQGAIFGPKVMIINESAGSGGDAMPWYFKRAGTGKLIGKRTWGGLVGRAGAPRLMDGGMVSAPSSGVWNPNGQWEVENVGIAPDIEIDHDPELVRKGQDPQLEKAIEVVLEELEREPPASPQRPPYPDYHGTPGPPLN